MILEICEYFGTNLKYANDIIVDMKKEISNWPIVVKNYRLHKKEIEQMESSFKNVKVLFYVCFTMQLKIHKFSKNSCFCYHPPERVGLIVRILLNLNENNALG